MRLCRYSKSDKIVEIVEMLIAKGGDIHEKDNVGWDALIYLCSYSENENIVEMVKLLIDQGIEVSKVTDKFRIPAEDCLKRRSNVIPESKGLEILGLLHSKILKRI